MVKQNSTPEVELFPLRVLEMLLAPKTRRIDSQRSENRPTSRRGLVVEEDGGGAGHGGVVELAVGAVQQVRRRRRHPLHQRRRYLLRLSKLPR